MSRRRTEVKEDTSHIKSGQYLEFCCVVTKWIIILQPFYLVYWELEESISIHSLAELITAGEYPAVYSVGDNCLVDFKKDNYGGVGS